MKSEWMRCKAEDFIEFNPRLTLQKGEMATKVAMDKLQPFTKFIPAVEQAAFSGGSKFCNGDTIMARITPCLENGKTAFVNRLKDDEVAFGSTEFIVMRAKPGISDPQFVYYLAISPLFRDVAIKSMIGSSGRQRVQQSVLNGLELTVPPLEEQRRIGFFLAGLDDKIALNQRIDANLERQAQMIFEFWSAKFEAMRQECRVVSLSDLMDYAGGSQPPASEFVEERRDGYIRFVQIRDYESDSHITYIPVSKKNKLCEEHDIMIARYGAALGRICFGLNGAYNVALAKVFPGKPYYREFLRCYLSSNAFYEGLNKKGGRSAQAGFNQSDIKSFQLLFPKNDSLLKEFESIVSPVFEMCLHIRKQNARLAALRNTLLPKLMSGEIRV